MKRIIVWLFMGLITFSLWAVTSLCFQYFPKQMIISLKGEVSTHSWANASIVWAFPIALTTAWVVITVLKLLHYKRCITLPYDAIDSDLSESLLDLTYFIIAFILFVGEICLVVLNR